MSHSKKLHNLTKFFLVTCGHLGLPIALQIYKEKVSQMDSHGARWSTSTLQTHLGQEDTVQLSADGPQHRCATSLK